MTRDHMTETDKERFKGRLLSVMAQHVGRAKRIGMGELYYQVFGESWDHRINDTRRLRTLVTELRNEGIAICSSAATPSSGYWLASAGSELAEYCDRLTERGIRVLSQVARIKKVSLPELAGQIVWDSESETRQ